MTTGWLAHGCCGGVPWRGSCAPVFRAAFVRGLRGLVLHSVLLRPGQAMRILSRSRSSPSSSVGLRLFSAVRLLGGVLIRRAAGALGVGHRHTVSHATIGRLSRRYIYIYIYDNIIG